MRSRRAMRSVVYVMVVGALALTAAGAEEEEAAVKAELWAGLGVTSPTVHAGDVKDPQFFMVSFALINDGKQSINPALGQSQLVVNGKALKDWGFIVGNGPRGQSDVLPPGQSLRFGYAMGSYFTEPGIYKIQWKGKSFASPVVEFRVLPATD